MALLATAGQLPAGASTSPAKVALTPVSVTAGTAGNVFMFKVSAVQALSGHTSIQVPAAWTKPQASNASGPGYVADAKDTCKSAGKPEITGSGPWTVTVAMTCATGKHFTVTYGAGTGTARVTAPATATSYTFATSVKLGTSTQSLSVPPVTVHSGPATRFVVSGLPAPSETGAPVGVSVTAADAFGNVATAYTGTVHFTSSDAAASLPGDYTFTAADSGVHTFAGAVTFAHEGTQWVTATDTSNSSITGSDSVLVDGVLFVSTSGSDAAPGTEAQPMRTVGAAVGKAAASSPAFAVDVAGGTYDQGGGVAVTSGITIEGGFDPSTWTQSGSEVSILTGAPQAVYAEDATSVVLADLTLEGEAMPGAGQSAYGLRAVNGSNITLDDVAVSAANGSAGSAGSDGVSGLNGGGGGSGGNGQSSGGCTSSFGQGGAGGAQGSAAGGSGGSGGCSGGSGNLGAEGTAALGGASGGGGGSAGTGDDQAAANGGAGGLGANGASGSSGVGASNTLGLATEAWTGASGGNGTSAQYGGGGGGGGGGGALTTGCFITCTYNGGAGGGGGGSGGAGGGFGMGGTFGGGSFGIYLWSSTLTAYSSTVAAGNGGPGGNGGNGGSGGTGASGSAGGSGSNGSGAGGSGGKGGNGGAGGSGAGGSGGPSIGISREARPRLRPTRPTRSQ